MPTATAMIFPSFGGTLHCPSLLAPKADELPIHRRTTMLGTTADWLRASAVRYDHDLSRALEMYHDIDRHCAVLQAL